MVGLPAGAATALAEESPPSAPFSAPLTAQAEPAPAPAAAPGAAPTAAQVEELLQFQPEPLPLAPDVVGPRPKSDPSVLPPAATQLNPDLRPLTAPASLGLPIRPEQVRIKELRPLGLSDVEQLAEFNNPNLKSLASQVQQAQSNLRAQIALWYPNINLNAAALPSYTGGQQYSSSITGTGQEVGNTITSIWNMEANLQATWSLINPTRVPQIAAARDQFEQAKNQYLIGLRDLRLQAAQAYFDLQESDEQVRIGQESVRASVVSLRDARARFQAGVATKLEVLEAETQLARDQQLLTTSLAAQSIARRTLAALLDLPQTVTPTAKDPARVLGTWLPSLQESIIAAYAFREELDNALLDISIANSQANTQLGEVQPFLNIVNTLRVGRSQGYEFVQQPIDDEIGWNLDNTIGLNLSWNLFDGGRAKALYRQQKQRAEENRFLFAAQRDAIRQEVETSFYELQKNNRNILTTTREVVSAREALRLARLRFQAGVTTQREVVDNQRDLTQAEVRYASAISEYNRRLAEMRRRTGLDQIALCKPQSLPAERPVNAAETLVPVEPQPLEPACSFNANPVN
ncbi:MAG: TolC family protein [Prochlorococcaceae cyanobacterium]|jgi:OMF family outer membrane factor